MGEEAEVYQDGDGIDSRDKIKKVGWRIVNPSEMPGSQSEVGSRCISRSLPLRATGTCL